MKKWPSPASHSDPKMRENISYKKDDKTHTSESSQLLVLEPMLFMGGRDDSGALGVGAGVGSVGSCSGDVSQSSAVGSSVVARR